MHRPFLERRSRARIQLKWPVSVHSERYPEPVTADLLNVSSGGAYCVSSMPFYCRDAVEIDLPLPSGLDTSERDLRLWCVGRVIRTEEVQPGLFGFACTFEDYTFLSETPGLGYKVRIKARSER
ncbi:MAG TPA: PilZ domain-containing protein [Bryobacteraceae bacterium]|nr:PilZ domain-containing protein [Bryobacteraceae bacterium]HOQ44539.1 PilZ domain-containing protein [Bryobacteraceae bacterium]HPQ13599.1 PilZ domain-containing protein [Bryobacteraceae bacterium]HPU70858.1 PilZ domain-containing protein [Bryobacteraceae bacterium]